MQNFVVHSNDSACRKIGCLGLYQVPKCLGVFGISDTELMNNSTMEVKITRPEEKYHYGAVEIHIDYKLSNGGSIRAVGLFVQVILKELELLIIWTLCNRLPHGGIS